MLNGSRPASARLIFGKFYLHSPIRFRKDVRGANRISASKLYEAARTLSVPISFFFENIPQDGPIDEGTSAFLYAADAVPLAQAFARIGTPAHRQAIIELMRELAEAS